MFKCKYTSYIVLLLFLFCPFRTGFAESCSTSSCHPGLLKKPHIHQPAGEGECESCHQQENSKHPEDKGPDFRLAADGEALCFECHEEFHDTFEHGPAVSGACFICHDPHASKQKSLLRMPLQRLCLDCHDDMASGLQEAGFVHSAINELDCGACHQPHGGEYPKFLKGETSVICFDCHGDIQDKYEHSLKRHEPLYSGGQCANCHQAHYSEYASLLLWEGNDSCLHCHGTKKKGGGNFRKKLEKEVIHAPIEDEGCVSCHDPHGSRHDAILTGAYPQSMYAPYKKGTYELCFQCHEESLLDKSRGDTAFRNGKANLHYLHVGRENKGRTCQVCHDVHSADGQNLISSEGTPFGDWKIPVRFEATDSGGGCMPGCHRAMEYDRKNPVDNSLKEDKEEKNNE